MSDTPQSPQPVTLDRIAGILDQENLNYLWDDDSHQVLRTGFPNAAISFFIDDESVLADSLWRGTATADRAPQLLAAVNEWNLTQISPILHFSDSGTPTRPEDVTLTLRAHRRLFSPLGSTDDQLTAFTMSSLELSVQCFNWLASQFPDLVTWQENHDDHA